MLGVGIFMGAILITGEAIRWREGYLLSLQEKRDRERIEKFLDGQDGFVSKWPE